MQNELELLKKSLNFVISGSENVLEHIVAIVESAIQYLPNPLREITSDNVFPKRPLVTSL